MKASRFDAGALIVRELRSVLKNGDVLVVSSKFLAMSEGRTLALASVMPRKYAKRLAIIYHMDERLCEMIIREADEIIGGIPGFLLTVKDGLIIPNAGIDRSNVQSGMIVLYPRRPEATAKRIRLAIRSAVGVEVAVVVCDSRVYPGRRGTTGVALASSGLEGVVDLRGKKDLFGNVLRVTFQAVADDLCSAAELLMGEADGRTPIVLVRGLNRRLLNYEEYPPARFAIPPGEDLYLRSLGYRPRQDGN